MLNRNIEKRSPLFLYATNIKKDISPLGIFYMRIKVSPNV